jgi:hypothetical protein
MKKPVQLDTKLKAYSAMALCFAGAGAANAQIVYHDVSPDKVITTAPDSLIIDFNNDATGDYVIKRFNWGSSTSNPAVIMPPALNNAIMATMGSVVPYVSALAAGVTIGGAVTTWIVNDGSSPQLVKFALASTYSGATYGHFNDGAEHFIGCKFIIGANTHYGWVRVQCVTGGGSGTIKDYAYNSTPNASILAGATNGIEDAATIENSIYAFNGNVYINFSSEIQGDINIFNSIGEFVTTEKISGQKTIINLSAQSKGIYLVKIASDKGNFIKKINL